MLKLVDGEINRFASDEFFEIELPNKVVKFNPYTLLKGDFDGHPFRGNQWSDSSGASQGGAGGRNTQQSESAIPDTYGGSFAGDFDVKTGKFIVDEKGMNNFIVRQHSNLSVTESERNAVDVWQSYRYADVNAVLRGTAKLDSFDENVKRSIKTTIAQLDKILSKATLDEDVIVFRGFNDEDSLFDDSEEGDIITDSGFTATTLNPTFAKDAAFGFIEDDSEGGNPLLLRILVPKGTPAFSAEKLSGRTTDPDGPFMKPDLELLADVGSTHSSEIVLPPKTNFRIEREYEILGQRVLDLEVIPNE